MLLGLRPLVRGGNILTSLGNGRASSSDLLFLLYRQILPSIPWPEPGRTNSKRPRDDT